MKIIYLLIPVIAALSFMPVKQRSKTLYYFCDSHAVPKTKIDGKQYIYLTDVKNVSAEENYMKVMAAKWGSFVSSQCRNSTGCTSDCNYYFTEANAREQIQKLKARYSDTSLYVIIKIEF